MVRTGGLWVSCRESPFPRNQASHAAAEKAGVKMDPTKPACITATMKLRDLQSHHQHYIWRASRGKTLQQKWSMTGAFLAFMGYYGVLILCGLGF